MKVSNKQLLEAIKQLFPNAQVVADDDETVSSIDEIISMLDASREPILKDRLRDSMHKELKGEWSGALLRKLMRQTGVSESALSSLDKDEDRIKAAVNFILEKASASQPDIQKTISDITAENAKALDAMKADYEGKLSESKKKYEAKEIGAFISEQIDSMPIRQGIDKKVLAKIVMAEICNAHDVGFDYNDNKVVVNKKGASTPSLNKAGNGLFSWTEAITDILTPLGSIAHDTGGVNPAEAMGGFGKNNNVNNGQQNNGDASLSDINAAVAAAVGQN